MALFDELYEQAHGFHHGFYLVLVALHDTLIILLSVLMVVLSTLGVNIVYFTESESNTVHEKCVVLVI
jgi:hypothetical protein